MFVQWRENHPYLDYLVRDEKMQNSYLITTFVVGVLCSLFGAFFLVESLTPLHSISWLHALGTIGVNGAFGLLAMGEMIIFGTIVSTLIIKHYRKQALENYAKRWGQIPCQNQDNPDFEKFTKMKNLKTGQCTSDFNPRTRESSIIVMDEDGFLRSYFLGRYNPRKEEENFSKLQNSGGQIIFQPTRKGESYRGKPFTYVPPTRIG